MDADAERPVHDRGGRSAGPIPLEEHEPAPWEKRTDALLVLLARKGHLRVDELRRAIEGLEPRAYETLSYYERWLAAMEGILVEKGVLTRAEVLRAQGEVHGRRP